jgi:hypothetical protein
MFKVLFYLFYGLGTLAALMCPFMLIYWLVDAAQFEFGLSLVSWFSPVYTTITSGVQAVWPFPLNPLPIGERSVSLMPAVAAGVMAMVFVAFTKLADYVKLYERKLETALQNNKAQQAAKKAERAQIAEKNQLKQFRQVLLFIQFPFREHPQLGQVFQQAAAYGGKELPGQPESLLLGFGDLQLAMAFAIQSSKTLLDYYKNAKPSDAKPPVRLALHPIWAEEKLDQGLAVCEALIKYAKPNQLLMSQALHSVLQAQGVLLHYRNTSVGVYLFPDNTSKEVYSVELIMPTSTPTVASGS